MESNRLDMLIDMRRATSVNARGDAFVAASTLRLTPPLSCFTAVNLI